MIFFFKENRYFTTLLLLSILIFWIKKHNQFIEEFYSLGLYQLISSTTLYFVNRFSISFGDLLYIFAPLIIYRIIKKSNSTRRGITISSINIILTIYVLFSFQWGLNYHRIPIDEKLGDKKTYSESELIKTTKLFIKETNTLQKNITSNDTTLVNFDDINDILVEESIKSIRDSEFAVNKNLNLRIKKSIFSTPLSYMGFGGYINPITLEAHINYNTPMFNMPTTISHEIAHQLGYSAENEANFIGIVSSINSKNEYIKYSGYALGLKYLLNEVFKRNKNEYKLLRSTINKGVLKNYEQANQTWLKFKNPLEKYFKKSYNIYLKANNQTRGIESYNLVVNLLINNYSNPEF